MIQYRHKEGKYLEHLCPSGVWNHVDRVVYVEPGSPETKILRVFCAQEDDGIHLAMDEAEFCERFEEVSE